MGLVRLHVPGNRMKPAWTKKTAAVMKTADNKAKPVKATTQKSQLSRRDAQLEAGADKARIMEVPAQKKQKGLTLFPYKDPQFIKATKDQSLKDVIKNNPVFRTAAFLCTEIYDKRGPGDFPVPHKKVSDKKDKDLGLQMRLWYDEKTNEAIFVSQGSNDLPDWIFNSLHAAVYGTATHEFLAAQIATCLATCGTGMSKATKDLAWQAVAALQSGNNEVIQKVYDVFANKLQDMAEEALGELKQKIGQRKFDKLKIVATGHSKGGAEACIVAAKVNELVGAMARPEKAVFVLGINAPTSNAMIEKLFPEAVRKVAIISNDGDLVSELPIVENELPKGMQLVKVRDEVAGPAMSHFVTYFFYAARLADAEVQQQIQGRPQQSQGKPGPMGGMTGWTQA